MPGSPLIAVSTGNVTKRSISTGLRPGACVSTSTWFGVTSGTASIGSRSIDQTPAATMTTVRMRTRNLLRKEKSISLSMASPV